MNLKEILGTAAIQVANRAGFELRRRPRYFAQTADDFLRGLITRDEPVVIDVGANNGASVVRFKKIFNQPIIHCFEPSPDAFFALQKAHGSAGVILNQTALSSSTGTASLNIIPSRNDLSSLEDFNTSSDWFASRNPERSVVSCEVSKTTFDEYWGSFQEKIDLMKIDTQGHEVEVLIGASGCLREPRLRPSVIEVEANLGNSYTRTSAMWEIDQPLSSHGYFLAYIKKPINLLANPHDQVDLIYVNADDVKD